MLSSLQSSILSVFGPDSSFWLPEPRSEYASGLFMDGWNPVVITSLIMFVIVIGSMTYFIIKYRRKGPKDVVSTVTHNTPVELVWTIIPLILVMWFFVVGFRGFVAFDTPPSNAIVIKAEGYQWSFQFYYPGGGSDKVLYVPVNTPVRLEMSSRDVSHALYIPNFHISRNMIAGRTTDIWFKATQLSGENGFPVYCTQYCGKEHSRMFTKVVVLSKEDYDKKLIQLADLFKNEKGEYLDYEVVGQKIYAQQCASCHTINGAKNTGPSWDNLWVRDHKFSNSPEVIKATDPEAKKAAYIAESVIHPEVKLVDGYGNLMSKFGADFSDNAAADPDKDLQDYVKYQKVLALVEYMKFLSDGKPMPDGTIFKYNKDAAPHFKEPKGSSTATPAASSQPAATVPTTNGKP